MILTQEQKDNLTELINIGFSRPLRPYQNLPETAYCLKFQKLM